MTKAQASYWSTVALFPRTGRWADGHAERPDRLLGRARRPHAAMQLALIDPEGRLLGNRRKLMRTAGGGRMVDSGLRRRLHAPVTRCAIRTPRRRHSPGKLGLSTTLISTVFRRQ